MKPGDKISMKCFSPVFIKRNGEERLVPCGKCPYCMSLRSMSLKQNCDFESMVSKSSYFVTLTYARESIPRMSVLKNTERPKEYDCFDNTPRLESFYNDIGSSYLGTFSMADRDFRNMTIKLNSNLQDHYKNIDFVDCEYPYLFPRDLQLFMKKIRKYGKKHYGIEKVRYYALGEYGPKRFRPHWHLLLWFNEEVPSSTVEKLVLSCWRYGRCSIDLLQGSCVNYVTSYSTGSHLVSPLHALHTTRPRVFHSVNFGRSVYDRVPFSYSVDGEDEPSIPERVSLTYAGRTSEYWVLRQVENRRFPRCSGYSSKSRRMRRLSYDLYRISEASFRDLAGRSPRSLKELCDFLYDVRPSELYDYFVYLSSRKFCLLYGSSFLSRVQSEHPSLYECATQYLYHHGPSHFFDTFPVLQSIYDDCEHAYTFGVIYRDLLISRKFYRICSDSNISPFDLENSIYEYYSRKELRLIQTALRQMEANGFDGDKSAFAITYYDDLYKYIRPDTLLEFNEYTSFITNIMLKKRKHKELNDVNNQFCYSLKDSFRKNYSRSYNHIK